MARPNDELIDRFRANLWRCRRRAGLSQEQLALLAALHRTQIGMLERGARMPRIDTLVKLASSLELSADTLLAGIEWLPARDTRTGTFWVGAGPVEPEQTHGRS